MRAVRSLLVVGGAALIIAAALWPGMASSARHRADGAAPRPGATKTATPRKPRKAAVKMAQCPAAGTETVAFGKIVDGESFVTRDGREVKLAGILTADVSGEDPNPASAAAPAALAKMLSEGPLTLAPQGARDRYNRVPAQVFVHGDWVQGRLLREGWVRADPNAASAACAQTLLAAETEARSAAAGYWAKGGGFALRGPEDLVSRAGTFQIVAGAVTTASVVNGRAYLNFGADYRRDFTVTVAQADMKGFRQAKMDLRKFAGRRVEVRGWVELFNGPEMEIASPAALTLLNDDGTPENGESPKQRSGSRLLDETEEKGFRLPF